jgi:uncharacterized membrane protein YeiH
MEEQLKELLRLLFSSFGTTFLQSAPETIQVFQNTVQWAAIVLTALAGVSEARRRELDFFGTLVIAFVVSVGGGTVRDLFLARYPLFWVTSPLYLITVVLVAIIGMLILSRGEHAGLLRPLLNPVQQAMRSDQVPSWVIVVDAMGLGLWAYLGTAYALQAGASGIVAPVFGVITASFGGILRDVLFAQTPSIFKRSQLYATSAAIGSVLYVVLFSLGASVTIGFILCVGVTFLVRMASVRFNILSM